MGITSKAKQETPICRSIQRQTISSQNSNERGKQWHTNETTNYGLSQFVGTDRPSWIDDYNTDMGKIDAAINATSQSVAKTYTKTEADAKFETKADATTKLDNKADKSSVYTKTEADGRFAPKTDTAPESTGLTAAEYNRLYVDANGILRCKPASN